MLALDLADQPLPERERLGVGIVDAENGHALLDPEQDDREELVPQLAPVLGLEVEGEDVLVLLRRVLRVLDRAVGPVLEPFGVLVRVGVVGRALKSYVEGHLHSLLVRRAQQMLKVLHGAESRVDGLVPAFFRADRPRAAGLVGSGLCRVVRAFAMRPADRMDWRKVEDVEPHLRDVRQPLLHIAERPMLRRIPRRARKQLVPGAEGRQLRVDSDLELPGVSHGIALVGVPLHQLRQIAGQRGRRRGGSFTDRGGVRHQAIRVGPIGSRGGRFDHARGDLQLERDVLSGLYPLGKLAAPRLERVDPALNGVEVTAELADHELASPTIVDDRHHRHVAPVLRRLVAPT